MIKIAEWIGDDEADKYKESVGGMGGFFNAGHIHDSKPKQKNMRWKDYLAVFDKEYHKYLEAIRRNVLENDLKLSGHDHQWSGAGIPLFSDKTVGRFSMRAWGDLMAAIWSEKEDRDYNYMNFYM
jgi:hypothetical protein